MKKNLFTPANLGECVFLRGHLGLRTSFCEDPMLEGMLEAVPMKGMTATLRKAAQEEALKEAQKIKGASKREAEARTLIGPKGGLPTLRKDLLRLAALLNVEVAEKDTIEVLKEKVRPIVNVLKEQPTASSTVAAKPAAGAKAKGARPKSQAKDSSASSVQQDQRPLSHLSEQQLLLQEKFAKMQAEILFLRGLIPPDSMPMEVEIRTPSGGSQNEDAEIPWPEEVQRLAAEGLKETQRQRLEAHYGNLDLIDLTAEQVAAAFNP